MESKTNWGDVLKYGFFLIIGVVILMIALNLGAFIKGLINGIFGANTYSSTVAWWSNVLGVAKQGTVIPDQTGQVGNAVSAASEQDTGPANNPQIQYDLARSAYAKTVGLVGPAVEGTAGWPWTSFDDWQNDGSPSLP